MRSRYGALTPLMPDERLLEAIEQSVALVRERASVARVPSGWLERVRAVLFALLELFDEQPRLAQLCVVQALAGGPEVLARRGQALECLTQVIDEGRRAARREPPALTAQGVVNGALGVIHARLLDPDGGSLLDLFNPLMSFIVTPYLGPGAARIELHRPPPVAHAPFEHERTSAVPAAVSIRLTPRTTRVLSAIAAQAGLSNAEVSVRAGVTDQGQISKLLARLAALGLIESRPGNLTHAWRLTRKGHELEQTIRRESAA
jgi:AcrR family transcriptional regulator